MALTVSGYVFVGAVAVAITYLSIEYLWGEMDISKLIVRELENAIEK